MSTKEAEDLLQTSVRIAQEERDSFWKEYQNKVRAGTAHAGLYQRALAAASVGSYGAYLADGSEYRHDVTFPFNVGFKSFWGIARFQ